MKGLLLVIVLWSGFVVGQDGKTEEKDTCLNIPGTLVKNNDDKLKIINHCTIVSFHIQLYNRWGNLLYESDHFAIPFDLDINERTGKKSGIEKFPSGTYFYTITYRTQEDVESVTLKGYLNIL